MTNFPQKLTSLGFSPDYKVLFEPLSDILACGALEVRDIETVVSRSVFFALIEALRARVIRDFIDDCGVDVQCSDGIIISPFAKIGAGTVIYSGTQIRSNVTIGRDCVIGPNSIVESSEIGDNCTVNATQIYSSVLEEGVKIGPFCHVRPNCRLGRGAKIGDFVEIKNSVVGADTHASHLTYIGDSDVGRRVNFGCGVVTVNYDGQKKARTTIGDDAFIGCNTNLIAPVKIGRGAYTAAGSTVTSDVPDDALAIARAHQINKEGWSEKRKK